MHLFRVGVCHSRGANLEGRLQGRSLYGGLLCWDCPLRHTCRHCGRSYSNLVAANGLPQPCS